jgi:hypothetical protein
VTAIESLLPTETTRGVATLISGLCEERIEIALLAWAPFMPTETRADCCFDDALVDALKLIEERPERRAMLDGTLTSLLLDETAKETGPEKLDEFSVARQVNELPALTWTGKQETSFGFSGINWILVETVFRATGGCPGTIAGEAVN